MSSRNLLPLCESVSCSVVPNSLQPHRLYLASLLCLWNSPGKNIGVGRHSLLQGYSRPRDQTQVSCTPGRFFTIWDTREALCLLSSKFSLRLCLIDSLLEFVPFSNPLITLGCQKTGMPSEKETTTFFFPPTKWKGKIVKTNKQKRKRKLIKQHQPKFLKVYWELTVCKN